MEEKNKDEMYMRKALAEAQQAYEAGEIPIGAIIVCKDRIIARAHNLTETLCDVTAHAEMQAITMAANELGGKYLTDCTLYVTVEPCPMWVSRSMPLACCIPRQNAKAASLRKNAAN